MRRPLALVPLLAAVAAAGCGVGAGGDVGPVSLRVTRDFGRVSVPGSPAEVQGRGQETVMRALQRAFDVKTRYGGGFVQSIGGAAGGRRGGRPVDWFYYVNGIEAPRGAAATTLRRGDAVWWDLHDWGAAQRVPAVVGMYPEPFAHGQGGRRFPARIECAPGFDSACGTIQQRLGQTGTIAGLADLGTRGGEELLRVLVGPWSAVREDFAARRLEQGPAASGVFARPAPDGRTLAVLDPRGRVVRTLGAGTGLVAATVDQGQPPTWIVSGTDAAGVAQAVRAFGEDGLRGKFAIAVRDMLPIALPAVGRP